MKKPIPCNYSIVRFLPYPEAGEFVNVGVVLHSPVTGFFDFRLEAQKTSRVTNFFPEMDSRAVLDALENCERELKRMRDEIGINGENPDQLNPHMGAALFREIIRPRETVIRFSGAGTALISDPARLLHELYEHYVERVFVPVPECQEP